MGKRVLIGGVIVAVVALPLGLGAFASPGDKAVGGGQTMVGDRGAGDTIAFTAQERAGAARGQVQYVDREGGTGQGQTVFHGVVECLIVSGNAATFAGRWTNTVGDFEIFVEDNGEPNRGADQIFIDTEPANPNCQEDDDEEREPTALGRGNIQVFDN